jgi:hypothetical protein
MAELLLCFLLWATMAGKKYTISAKMRRPSMTNLYSLGHHGQSIALMGDVDGLKSVLQRTVGPLIVYQRAHSNPLFQRVNFLMVPTWCQA